ncbi:hypothetical protein, variant 1 [Aphanomyces astaci]|uniref:RRM domain-containing protein n=1 Tax=Aphanomyces astaci TaxID=112090 RepID=W4FZF7_APHAT|nr:hypothetical protein, variant 1 [Aphanomyces astaci]ETV72860.1 hypothetical protein, variant 1 [Aphanomyces astaci]|eukprot:XP_009837647.1 hypothetical protein, variant 1 [Aphanomyces astaci]
MQPRQIMTRPSAGEKNSRTPETSRPQPNSLARSVVNPPNWRETAPVSSRQPNQILRRQVNASTLAPPPPPPTSLTTRRWETPPLAKPPPSLTSTPPAPTTSASSQQTSVQQQPSQATTSKKNKQKRSHPPPSKVKASTSFSLADFVSSKPASAKHTPSTATTKERSTAAHHNTHHPSASQPKAVHSTASDNRPAAVSLGTAAAPLHATVVATPHGHLVGPPVHHERPKKKKLSTLKKRVLKDRAAKWAAFHNHIPIESTTSDQAAEGGTNFATNDLVRTVVAIHLVDPDEVHEDDEYDDTLEDVTVQFGKHGQILSLSLDRSTGTISIEYEDAKGANAAVAAMHNVTFGGQHVSCLLVDVHDQVKCKLQRQVVVDGFCDMAELEDPDEFDEVQSEVQSTFGTTPHTPEHVEMDRTTGSIRLLYASPKQAKEVAMAFHGKAYGGRSITAIWMAQDGSPSGSTSTPTTKGEGGQVLSELPSLQRLPNAQAIREYVDQRVDVGGEVEGLVVAFLGRLMSLQERARLTNPLKAKKTRRLVFGLREVKRGVKNGKVVCLMVAYNIDECAAEGGLDDKVMELIDLARLHNTPVIFSLSKYT